MTTSFLKTGRAALAEVQLIKLGALVASHHHRLQIYVCQAAPDSYPVAFLVPQRQNALPYQWLSLFPGHG